MRGLRVLCWCGAVISLLACSEKIYKSVPAPQATPSEDPQAYYSNSPTPPNLNERYKYLKIIHDLYTPTTPSFMLSRYSKENAASYFVQSRCEKQIEAIQSLKEALILLPEDFQKICSHENLFFVPGAYIRTNSQGYGQISEMEVVLASDGTVAGYRREDRKYRTEQEFKMIKDGQYLVEHITSKDETSTSVKELKGLYQYSMNSVKQRELFKYFTKIQKKLEYNIDAQTVLGVNEYVQMEDTTFGPRETSVSCEIKVKKEGRTLYEDAFEDRCFNRFKLDFDFY